MSNKAISRSKAIYELLKIYRGKEELTNMIFKGFIPESIKSEYEDLYSKYLIETKGQEDTDYDMSLFSNYFYLNDENKIVGEEKQGSGYINPVKTVGDINNIDAIIKTSKQPKDFIKEHIIIGSIPKTESQKEKEVKQPKTNNIKMEWSDDLYLLKRINEHTKSNSEKPKTEMWTIEESLKFYSPLVTDAEIKGHVYHKQKHGVPMYGWEKWFLPTDSPRGKYCVSNKATNLKNQQFQDVKLVPSDTNIGVKTRFQNEYSGTIYWVVKDESGNLYYANENDFIEKSSFATTSESELIKLVQERGLCYCDGQYIPVYMYVRGDIFELKTKFFGNYNKESDSYENGQRDEILAKFGKDVADWHESLINDAYKSLKLFDFANPISSERPYLSKENELSESFLINELDIDCGVSIKKYYDEADRGKRRYNSRMNYGDDTKISLFEAFKIWFNSTVTDTMLDKTTTIDIREYYFKNSNIKVEKSADKSDKDIKKEKEEKRVLARQEGEKYYSDFLATCLTRNDLSVLNILFNKRFNTFKPIDLNKVPVGFETNRNIFNKSIILKPVQRAGLAFMSLNNSGCLAYDVGFGKTLCAIHNLAILLKQGQIKRPLIAVPKQVYKNWIYEMFGCWTNGAERSVEQFEGAWFVNGALTGTKYKLNSWFNLGSGHQQPNKLVDEYSITLVTYQGLAKIGFSQSLYSELSAEMYEILNTTEESESRRAEKEKEKAEGNVGKALMKTEIDIDIAGFDYIVLDEAHAFKNIFGTFAIPETYVNAWRIKGTQSARGLKAFVLCLYLQKKYNGAVNLLTATPFTNSPFELFSMLSLVGYNEIAKGNINNMFKFLSLFIETQVEYTVDFQNKIELNTVIKSFKNKNILRDLLYSLFDYQDNPKAAGIKRPCKLNFPNQLVSTFLQMSETQKEIQLLVEEEANNYSPENKGAVGRAMSWAKSNSFSPYAPNLIESYDNIDEFINESPKLKYTIECIKTVKKYHESKGQECSGQVIYSNRGKSLFKDFKKALETECGFERKVKFGEYLVDEVEIITSSNSDEDAERKEIIKDAFNEGFVKVIIGTATIQEGINLQKRGTILYNLDLDWNPTAFKQLEGRIHRQQNLFKYVRIIVPMVQGTLDSFINQKLDEKSKRIASIWDKVDTANTVSVNDALDPMEIKFNLITDENELVKMKYDTEIKKAEKQKSIKFEKFESFDKLQSSLKDFEYYRKDVLESFEKTNNNIKSFLLMIDKFVSEKVQSPLNITDKQKIIDLKNKLKDICQMYSDFIENKDYKKLQEIKRAINSRRLDCEIKQSESNLYTLSYSNLNELFNGNYYSSLQGSNYYFDSFMGAYAQCKRYENTLLRPYNLTMFDNIEEIKNDFEKEYKDSERFIEYLKSEEYKNKIINEVRAELMKRQQGIGTLEDRVNEFKNYNCLLSYPFDEEDAENCEIPTCVNDKDGDSFLKHNLEVDEYLDFEDISLKTTHKKLSKIQDFMNSSQLSIVKRNIPEFKEVINRLYKTIVETPELYKTEEVEMKDKMAYLHYFIGGSDWFVNELNKKDVVDDNLSIEEPVFGFACLNGDVEMSEFGYFDINELKEHGVELDFHFDPKPMHEAFPQKFKSEIDIEPIAEIKVEAEQPKTVTTIADLEGRINIIKRMIEKGKGNKDQLEGRINIIKRMIEKKSK